MPAMGERSTGSAPDHKLLDRGGREARGSRVLILLTFSVEHILNTSLTIVKK